MSDEKKYCLICGKELTGRQKKYCSKKCMGLSKQGYKICVVCGKKFKDSASNQNCCCSYECSKIHRQNLHKVGVYNDTMNKMHKRYSEKVEEIGKNNHWISKHWVISSPEGKIYECDNLLNFIREHQELFDGTVRQACDGIQKIKASQEGKRKRPTTQWKGWKLISCTENIDRYRAKK